MEQCLEAAAPTLRRPKRSYSSRHRRDVVGNHPFYSLFVSGSGVGSDEKLYCRICHRDVSMRSRGAGEFSRHFNEDRHWQADVKYRVREGLPVYNKLMDPLELSAEQNSDYLSRPCRGLAEGFSFWGPAACLHSSGVDDPSADVSEPVGASTVWG